MSKFKVGQHVRVTMDGYWLGNVGVVYAVDYGHEFPVCVNIANKAPMNFRDDELILADVVESQFERNKRAVEDEIRRPLFDTDNSIAYRITDPAMPRTVGVEDLVAANNAEFVARLERKQAEKEAVKVTPVPVRAQILRTAEKLIRGQRAKDYGEPQENFGRIADLWNAQFGRKLKEQFTAGDVALALVHLKLSRLANTPDHEDSFTDACGYLALGAEIAEGL